MSGTQGVPARRRSLASAIGDHALTVAALGGVICIGLVIAASVFNVTLIMFKTGSMAPTIPAGSVALVREVPADEVRVGDIVTVDRRDALPVTHRVTSVTPGLGDTTILTMRGDANATDDPHPYTVSRVRVAMGWLPGVAPVVVAMSNPLVLGAITLGAAGIVTWAFWPRDAGVRARHVAGRGRYAAAVMVVAAGGMLGASVLHPHAARAAVTEETFGTGIITLTSIADHDAMNQLVANNPVHWQVGVTADAPDGDLTTTLLVTGALAEHPDGLHVSVSSCTERWVAGVCASGATVLVEAGPASDIAGAPLTLEMFRADEERWVLLEAWITDAAAALHGESAVAQLAASGFGEDVVDGNELVPSGANDVLPAIAAAGGAVALGLLLALIARRTRRVEP